MRDIKWIEVDADGALLIRGVIYIDNYRFITRFLIVPLCGVSRTITAIRNRF